MKKLLNERTGKLLDEYRVTGALVWRKFDVGLVLAGVKPATTWIINSDFAKDCRAIPAIDRKRVDEVIELITLLGLLIKETLEDIVEGGYSNKPYRRRIVLLIAQDQECLQLNEQLWGDRTKNQNDGLGGYPNNDRLYGRLAGFPETAIDAYIQKDGVKDADLPKAVRDSKGYVAMRFLTSKNHWQEEFKTAAKWADLTETYLPKTFLEMERQIRSID